MTTEDFLERIAVELNELNATLNCRFDALDQISDSLKSIDDELCFVKAAIQNIR